MAIVIACLVSIIALWIISYVGKHYWFNILHSF
jgi:hypothetical protein